MNNSRKDVVHAHGRMLLCHELEILMHVMLWISPEDLLSEISQKKTNTLLYFHEVPRSEGK